MWLIPWKGSHVLSICCRHVGGVSARISQHVAGKQFKGTLSWGIVWVFSYFIFKFMLSTGNQTCLSPPYWHNMCKLAFTKLPTVLHFQKCCHGAGNICSLKLAKYNAKFFVFFQHAKFNPLHTLQLLVLLHVMVGNIYNADTFCKPVVLCKEGRSRCSYWFLQIVLKCWYLYYYCL